MKQIRPTPLIIVIFCISWIGVLPSLLVAYGVNISPVFAKLEIMMTLGPLVGAMFFIGKSQGKEGIEAFLKKFLRFRAVPAVIFVTISLPILISLLSSVIGLSISQSAWPSAFALMDILSNGMLVFVVYLVVNTEELVWRGIVFDHFLLKYSYLKSCLILIPIWWLFHIPLFLYPEGHPAGYGMIEFTCIVVAMTFILGWIYIKTSGSLFYVHIHHQLLNGFGQAFPIFPIFIRGNKTPVLTFCVLLLLTAGFLVLKFQKQNQFEIIATETKETHT